MISGFATKKLGSIQSGNKDLEGVLFGNPKNRKNCRFTIMVNMSYVCGFFRVKCDDYV